MNNKNRWTNTYIRNLWKEFLNNLVPEFKFENKGSYLIAYVLNVVTFVCIILKER